MLASLFVFFLTNPFDFYQNGPYIGAVPRPEQVLGYGPGERHTTFREQERVVLAIAGKASDRVKMFEYGKTAEGRPLKVFAISSPENIRKLDQIRSEHQDIANGEGNPKTTPVIVWINECIHGNETASFESGMWLMYTLAASNNAELQKALKNTVVIYNPVYNPDGHERFVVWYNSIATGSAKPYAYEKDEPRVINGRSNHFRFDMNRDRVAMSQDETRQEVKEFLKWNPQVYVDQHGETSSYFFPPTPMSINAAVDRERYIKWTTTFGKANASAFDGNGWTYFVRDTYDCYFPGYLDSFTSLSGAIGMTYETIAGGWLTQEREDGSLMTLQDGMAEHFTSALATIKSASLNHDALMDSYASFKKNAVSGKHAGKFQRVIVNDGSMEDKRRLQEHLARSGIVSEFNLEPVTQMAHDYWSGKVEQRTFPVGSLIIDMAQPQGPLAKTLLEPGSDFEPEFLKAQMDTYKKLQGEQKYPDVDGPEFYDLTGWCLIYGWNLQASWCETAPSLPGGFPDEPSAHFASERRPVGWILSYTDRSDLFAAWSLLKAGLRVQQTTKPMTIEGNNYRAGAFLVMANRNEEGFDEKRATAEKKFGIKFWPLYTSFPETGRQGPGSSTVRSLKKPEVAIVYGEGANISRFGAIWWLMEREFKLPFTSIPKSALSGDLTKFTCIVFPGGSYDAPSEKLKEWVRNGGCIVSLGSPNWAMGDKGFVKLVSTKKEKDKDLVDLPGSLFKAELDPDYWLSYGYQAQGEGKKIMIAVPIEGSTFYKSKPEGGGAVTLSSGAKDIKLLSGWAWPDTEKAITDSVWLHDEAVGRGHVILFMQDPTDRAMWPGLYKLVLNAMLMGPG